MIDGSSPAQPAIRLPAGFRLVALESVGSTNDEAKRLAREGAADRTVVWARRQEAGRGRRGRHWVSPEGNLYCSVVLRPEDESQALRPEWAANAAQLSFVAALAVGGAVAHALGPGLRCRYKWPNDVLVNGRKVAGILLESEPGANGRLEWLVLGVGINLRHFPEGTEYPATALAVEGADDVQPGDILENFCGHLKHWLDRWQADGFAPVREAWLRQAMGLSGPITVRLHDRSLVGTFHDLDADGALLLDEGNAGAGGGGLTRITAGDVFFGPTSREG